MSSDRLPDIPDLDLRSLYPSEELSSGFVQYAGSGSEFARIAGPYAQAL